MKKWHVFVLVGAVCACASGYGFALDEQERAADEIQGSPAIQEFAGKTYVCENDAVSMDEPGKCPVCGNDLVEKIVEDTEVTEMPEVSPAEEAGPAVSE